MDAEEEFKQEVLSKAANIAKASIDVNKEAEKEAFMTPKQKKLIREAEDLRLRQKQDMAEAKIEADKKAECAKNKKAYEQVKRD